MSQFLPLYFVKLHEHILGKTPCNNRSIIFMLLLSKIPCFRKIPLAAVPCEYSILQSQWSRPSSVWKTVVKTVCVDFARLLLRIGMSIWTFQRTSQASTVIRELNLLDSWMFLEHHNPSNKLYLVSSAMLSSRIIIRLNCFPLGQPIVIIFSEMMLAGAFRE